MSSLGVDVATIADGRGVDADLETGERPNRDGETLLRGPSISSTAETSLKRWWQVVSYQ